MINKYYDFLQVAFIYVRFGYGNTICFCYNFNKITLQYWNVTFITRCNVLLWNNLFDWVCYTSFISHYQNIRFICFDTKLLFWICRLIIMYKILPETEQRSLEDIELHYSDNSKGIYNIKIQTNSKFANKIFNWNHLFYE